MIKLVKSTFHQEATTKAALVEYIRNAKTLSMGEETVRFEEAFAKKQGRKHAVFVNSGSSANLIIVQALLNLGRLKKGDRVGFSALTWSTNVMPLIELGLAPVPIDCERATLNVSTETLGASLDSLDALFLTDVLGFASDIGAIREACAKRGVLFLEDACESLGSSVGGTLLGNFGLASSFSFFVGHHLSTIEGGMVVTDDAELYDMLTIVRAHGWGRYMSGGKETALMKEHGVDDFYARYTFYDLGYNVRSTDINAYIGLLQLPYWDEIVERRQKNFHVFHAATQENPHLIPLDVGHLDIVSNFAMPLIFKERERCEAAKRTFAEAQVEIRPIVAGDITRQPFYRKHVGSDASCPHAAFVHQHGFYFPNHEELTGEEVATLVRLVSTV